MKAIRLAVLIVLLVVVIAFAVANREAVNINFYPLPFVWRTASFLPILGAFAAGILIGGFYYWIAASRWRWRARNDERRIERLEQKLSDMVAADTPAEASSAARGKSLTLANRQPPRVHAAIHDD